MIYTIGPSYMDVNRIWVGTDDGVIPTTADGGVHWNDVTPPQMTACWKVFIIDAGRFDPLTAYAAVNTLRLDDMNPHIFRTHDGGKTWTEIVDGIPGGAPVSVVREDPKRKGLLFAGSETQVYVSFDDGDHWQSLRLNMAGVVGARSGDQGRRPGRRHARPRDLDPRRHHAAAADRRDDGRRRRDVSCSSRSRRCACAGTRTPTRRGRPTSRPRRIRPTARSSTTT